MTEMGQTLSRASSCGRPNRVPIMERAGEDCPGDGSPTLGANLCHTSKVLCENHDILDRILTGLHGGADKAESALLPSAGLVGTSGNLLQSAMEARVKLQTIKELLGIRD